jgi:hypothetical protein
MGAFLLPLGSPTVAGGRRSIHKWPVEGAVGGGMDAVASVD